MTNTPGPGPAERCLVLEPAEGIEGWFIEKHAPYTGHVYGVKKTIYKAKTPFQEIAILDLHYYGKTLVLDGKIQSSEDSEWIYHEALVHPVLLAHERPERVLIIGGGEGATAREVLRHRTVRAVEMVEIDIMVYEACKRFLPEFHGGAFDDVRFSLIVGDGRRFLEALAGRPTYDVVIIDVTDPLEGGPSYLLYTREFYEVVKSALRPGGLMVTQAEDINTQPELSVPTISIYRTVRAVFPIVRYYRCWVPSFDGEWAFVVGSTGPDPAALTPEEVEKRLKERGVKGLRFYTPEVHASLFALPKYLKDMLENYPRGFVIEDGRPVYVYSGS